METVLRVPGESSGQEAVQLRDLYCVKYVVCLFSF